MHAVPPKVEPGRSRGHVDAVTSTFSAAGEIRLTTRCLDVTNAGTAAGAPTQLFDRNQTDTQQWFQRPDGQLQNPKSGLCLGTTNNSADDGTKLVLSPCTVGSTQRAGPCPSTESRTSS
jgi:hypothetical protein